VITEPLPLVTNASVTSNYNSFGVSCGDVATGPIDNGSLETTSSGGTSTYSYTWTTFDGVIPAGQESVQTPTGLTAGTYDVSVTDVNNCTVTDQIIVNEPVVLTLDNLEPSVFGLFNLSGCDPDGTITTTMSGGVTPYTYAWTGPNGFTASTEDLSALAEGDYEITLTDNLTTCEVTESITVDPANAPVVTATVANTTCGQNNGLIDIEISGGTEPFIVTWNGDAATLDQINLAAGTYSVVITDANNCLTVENYRH
jgi:hypothetical protein